MLAQTPSFSISPQGTMSVCAGTNVSLTSTLSNAFPGTSSYTVGDVPFSPYAIPGGTPLNMNDDTIIGPLPIGFQFCFFGNTYTQFYLGSNGWIGFSPGQPRSFVAMSVPYALPSPPNPGVPKNCIMGPWMDFNPKVPGGPYIKYQTQGTAPYRRLVVQWTNCPLYLCTSLKATLQIVIFESTNIIENYITNKPTCNAWAGGTSTQALHNQMGTVAVSVPGRNASVWTATNDGKRYTPNGPPGYTINWTANGFPIGSGTTASYTVNAFTRLIGRATFQCSNLILYDTLDVSIGGAASAAFSVNGSSAATPPSVCVGQAVNLSYTGGSAGTAAWTMSGGTPASGSGYPNQTVTYPAAGTYPVSLTLTPSGGSCSPGSSSKTITVIPAPASTVSLPASACINTAVSVSYGATPVAGASYTWNFGSGASPATATGLGPHSVQWSTSGSKTVSLTVSAGSCTSSGTGSIAITAAPVSAFTVSPAAVCVGANANISFNGVAPSGTTYSWNFGSGASTATASSAGPFSINWSGAGTKTISLTVSSGGCSSTSTQNLTVSSPPSASFTAPASVCVGANATLSYTGGAGAPPAATYVWGLDGGSPAAGNIQGPLSVSWSTAGTKTLSLSVSQNGCTSTPVTRTINVLALPVVSIAPSVPTQCTGQPVSFSVSAPLPSPGSSYQWTFSGGSPASSVSAGPVNVSWASAGSRSASLVVTSNGCSSLPANASVSITNPASATISLPATACENAPVSVSASGSFAPGTTFTWNFNGGTVISGSGQGPYSIRWASAGSKTVSLTTSLGSCSSSSSAAITISAAPVVNITYPANVCENQAANISFSGTAGPGASFAWNFGTGASPAGAGSAGPHSVSWSGSGSKTVSLTVSSGSCSTSATQVVNVKPAFSPAISLPASICAGSAAAVSYSGTPPAGASYTWNFGAGASPATANGVGPHNVSWSSAGSPTINLSVSSGGCTYSTGSTATVKPLPPVAFSLASSSCSGSATPVSISPVAGASYSWNFGTGASPASASGAGPHGVSWPSAGSRSVSLTATLNGCSASGSQNITVNPIPSASFTVPSTACSGVPVSIQYTGSASSGASYTWNPGAGAIPSGISGQGPHSVSFPAGNRTISLTVSENGCSSSSFTQTIQVNASPTSNFNLSSPGCINSPVTATYTGTAGPGASFSWSYPGGTLLSGSGSGPLQLSWNSAGLKTVSLVVSENSCTSAATSHTVQVNAPASFSISSPVYVGLGMPGTVTYNGVQAPGATYSWNFDGGIVLSGSGAGPYSIQWNSPGTKNIQCSVTVGGCNPVTNTSTSQVMSGAVVSFTTQSPLCVAQVSNIQFTGMTFGSPVFQWDFDGGTVLSGSGAGPYQVSWASAGTKTVKLKVTDLGITSAEVSHPVMVNAVPTSGFSMAGTACSGRDVAVQYTGTGSPAANLSWNFGGGTVQGSPGIQNLVRFAPGAVQVSLSVTENGCTSSTNTQTIQVKPTPLASFTTASSVCEKDYAQLIYTGNAGATASYSWWYPGADHIAGSSPDTVDILWQQPGNQTVSLLVQLNGCASDTIQQSVQVKGKPLANFAIAAGHCSGDTVHLTYTGQASASASYTWSYPGASLVSGAGQGPISLIYSTPGSHTISLNVQENACASDTVTQAITQHQQYLPAFGINDTIYISQTAQALFSGSVPATVAYGWRYPGANLHSGSGPGPIELSWNQSGTHTVYLQLDNQGCLSPELSRNVVVLPIPSSQFFVSNDSICTGTMVWANYGGPVVPVATYQWDFDGATILSGSGAGPYQLSWQDSGTKHITLVISINGQSSSVWQESIRVIAMPHAPFSIPSEVCAGSPVFPVYSGTQSNSNQFNWSYDDGQASGAQSDSPQFIWSTPGLKTVTLSVADAMCISALESHSIRVYSVPTADFTAPSYVCTREEAEIAYVGQAGNSAQFIWNLASASGDTARSTSPFEINWTNAGMKTLSLQVEENGCISAPFVHQLEVKARPQIYAGTDQLLCSGDTIQLDAQSLPGIQYRWYPSGGLNNDSIAQAELSLRAVHSQVDTLIFRLEGNDGYCSGSDSIQVVLAPMPEAKFTLPEPQCFNGNAFDFKADGAFTEDASFLWNFGPDAYSHTPYEKDQENIHFEATGKHPVSLTISQYGCSSNLFTDSITVYGHPDAAFDLSPVKGCLPLLSTFTVRNPVAGNSYFWQFGDGSNASGSQTSHTYKVSGYMTVELLVNDSNGCKTAVRQESAIEVLERPVAGFRVMPEVADLGKEVELTNLSHNAKYSYYIIGGDTILGATSAYSFNETGTHIITQVVINADGCEDEISHQVLVEYGTTLFIPTAFTPNNDGTNDIFRIEGTELFQYNLIVFDRWGLEVFSSQDSKEGWTGYAPSGEPLPEGVYGYILEARDKDNHDIRESGQVTLIR